MVFHQTRVINLHANNSSVNTEIQTTVIVEHLGIEVLDPANKLHTSSCFLDVWRLLYLLPQ